MSFPNLNSGVDGRLLKTTISAMVIIGKGRWNGTILETSQIRFSLKLPYLAL
jgi:hypothetical protein